MRKSYEEQAQLQPVIIGSDVSVYAWARAFHEAYGVKSIVVSNQPRGPVSHSKIIELHLAGANATQEQKMQVLRGIAQAHPNSQLILIANAEHDLELIEHYWDEMNELFLIPTSDPSTLEVLQDKDQLAQLCAKLGIRTPQSITVEAQSHQLAEIEKLDFPLIVKPTRSGEYSQMSFPGQRKVYLTRSRDELQSVLNRVFDAGYDGELIIQEYIPGDEQANLNVTAYRDKNGKVTVTACSRMMLGHQTPALLGVAVSMLPQAHVDIEQQVIKLLESTDYRGYANVDFKVHADTKTAVLLDFNPRIGRSLHLLLVIGINPAVALVNDWLHDGRFQELVPNYQGVYSLTPKFWVKRYILDRELKQEFSRSSRSGKIHPHPLVYRGDRVWKKTLYRYISSLNIIRRFIKVYPRPTSSGFAQSE